MNNRKAGKLESALMPKSQPKSKGLGTESYEIMNSFRQTVRHSLDRNKPSVEDRHALVQARADALKQSKSAVADIDGQYGVGSYYKDEYQPPHHQDEDEINTDNYDTANTDTDTHTTKQSAGPRLSKADRKKVKNMTSSEEIANFLKQLKQQQQGQQQGEGSSFDDNHTIISTTDHTTTTSSHGKHNQQQQSKEQQLPGMDSTEMVFRDTRYFMSYGHESAREEYIENASQPMSALKSSETLGE